MGTNNKKSVVTFTLPHDTVVAVEPWPPVYQANCVNIF